MLNLTRQIYTIYLSNVNEFLNFTSLSFGRGSNYPLTLITIRKIQLKNTPFPGPRYGNHEANFMSTLCASNTILLK